MLKNLLKLSLIILLFADLVSQQTTFALSSSETTISPSQTNFQIQTTNGERWLKIKQNHNETQLYTYQLVNLSDKFISVQTEFQETTGIIENISILENQPAKNIGNWQSGNNQTHLLSPHEKKLILFPLTTPNLSCIDQCPTYQGAILAKENKPTESGLNIVTRLGLRVYLEINSEKQTNNDNTTPPTAPISILTGLLTLAYTLKNSAQV